MAEREGFPERLGQSCSSQRSRCVGPWGLPGAPLLTGLPPRSSRHWRRSALPPASPATTRRSSFRPSLPGAEVPMLIFTGWFFAGLWPAVPFESLSPLLATQKSTPRVLFCFGGERGIRTLDTLMRYTRFPVVRLRPARPSLQMGEGQIRFTQL